jgi:hypothetical protein
VEELLEIRRAAAALGPMEPPGRVWTSLERAIGDRGGRGVWRRKLEWGWFATAAALLLVTSVGIWFLLSDLRQHQGDTYELAASVEIELREAEQHYQNAITKLEAITSTERTTLDPATAATLQKNLAAVDQAISESRVALRAQPDSESAQQSLLDGLKTKVGLLQDTIGLIIFMNDKQNAEGQAPTTAAPRGRG